MSEIDETTAASGENKVIDQAPTECTSPQDTTAITQLPKLADAEENDSPSKPADPLPSVVSPTPKQNGGDDTVTADPPTTGQNGNGQADNDSELTEPAAKKLKTDDVERQNGTAEAETASTTTDAKSVQNGDGGSDADKANSGGTTELAIKEKDPMELKREQLAQEVKLREIAAHERKKVEEKCPECSYMCWTDAEMLIHRQTSHGSRPRRMRMCANCSYTCQNTWEMDYHARSRGHKAKEVITCKKCDFLCETKEESWEHKKVHIPQDKLFECGDCTWCSERLDNMRYHEHSQDHKTKIDYEAIARSKAEEKGPKELKHYLTKLAKDIKKAKSVMAKK